MGGAIFNFSPKIDLKTTKKVQFCILHKSMGRARAPPRFPPLATLLYPRLFCSNWLFQKQKNRNVFLSEKCGKNVSERQNGNTKVNLNFSKTEQ